MSQRLAGQILLSIGTFAVLVFAFVLYLQEIEDDKNAPKKVAELNEEHLAGEGEYIGTLPDGRKIVRYYIYRHNYRTPHTLYVVDGVSSITVNRVQQNGKSIENRTEVYIDSKEQ